MLIKTHQDCDRITNPQASKNMDCYSQNGRMLEEFVEDILELYNEARWDDETLKQLFWSGMDDILGQMLLVSEDHLAFVEFVEYVLWVCGSSLTVGVMEDHTICFDFLGPTFSSHLSACSR